MSVLVRKKKTLKECDGSGCCGGDAGGIGGVGVPFVSAATNISGMGNPVPPSENSLGSGDNFGGAVAKVSTQVAAPKIGPRFKIRKKKK